MKIIRTLAMALVLAGGAASLNAASITFDENGNATSDAGTVTFFSSAPLLYSLPFTTAAGYFNITNAGVTDDVLFFTNSANDAGLGANLMAFYSSDAYGSLADSGALPTSFTDVHSNAYSLLGTVAEAVDGTFTFSQSGNTFNGTSDTPEPATLSMLLLGFGGLGLGAFRRKARS